MSMKEWMAKNAAEWEIAKARAACDYNDESKRKGFCQLAGEYSGKPFNELTPEEVRAFQRSIEESIKVPVNLDLTKINERFENE